MWGGRGGRAGMGVRAGGGRPVAARARARTGERERACSGLGGDSAGAGEQAWLGARMPRCRLAAAAPCCRWRRAHARLDHRRAGAAAAARRCRVRRCPLLPPRTAPPASPPVSPLPCAAARGARQPASRSASSMAAGGRIAAPGCERRRAPAAALAAARLRWAAVAAAFTIPPLPLAHAEGAQRCAQRGGPLSGVDQGLEARPFTAVNGLRKFSSVPKPSSGSAGGLPARGRDPQSPRSRADRPGGGGAADGWVGHRGAGAAGLARTTGRVDQTYQPSRRVLLPYDPRT
jgi:hypothetical protein